MFGIHLHRPKLIHMKNFPFVSQSLLSENDRSRRVQFNCHCSNEHHRPKEKENDRTNQYI